MDPEPGEEIFFHGHPSWRSIIAYYGKGLVAAILAGAVAGVISAISSSKVDVAIVIIVVVVVLLLVLLIGVVQLLRTTYTITNQRLTIDIGLLSRDLPRSCRPVRQ